VSKKSLKIGEADVDLLVWDILGQKIHESLHAAYYRGAAGAFVVSDFTRPETMNSLKSWVGNFRSTVGDKPIIILGNKSDLTKAYSLSELQTFGSGIGCEVAETSAKTGLNVEKAFLDIGKMILESAR
jgi:GTPase SAR1 family protein